MKSANTPALWLKRYCSWLERWHGLVVVLSLCGAIVGGYYSALLYANLKTDMEELLPESAQSVKDLRKVTGRVGGLNHLSIVIQSANREAGRRFQRDVAQKLSALPKSLVARVKYSIKEERAFFESHRALYIDTSDWVDIENYVRNRIHDAAKHKNPFSLGLDDEESAGSAAGKSSTGYDFEALKRKYKARAAETDRFPDGIFESVDGRTHVVLAFLPGKVTDMDSNDRLSEAAHQIVAGLRPTSYAPDLVVGFSGDVQNVVEEHRGLVADLVKSFVAVMLLVGVALLLFYRSFFAVYALCASLFAGTAWTFGLSYWLVGYLNANTAFLGSIVLGNGINFGIIVVARYLEERRRGVSAREAMPLAVGLTMGATSTAALAAGLSYASLMLTDFRGFNQFGVIGGLGMGLCWISSFTTLPALLIWVERRKWLRVKVGAARPIFFARCRAA